MSGFVEVQAIIQARMGSERLPGKILERVGDKTILEWVTRRILAARRVGRVIIATTLSSMDDPVEQLAETEGVGCFRGSDEDVLDRFVRTLDKWPAKAVVRATGDNPLLDTGLLDAMIEAHTKTDADHTGLDGAVPLGTAAEIVSATALKRAWEAAAEPAHREHVTTYIHSNPDDFRLERIAPPDYLAGRGYRLTVDTGDDLELLRRLYELTREAGIPFNAETAVKLLDRHPELVEMNRHVKQRDWRDQF